jgi:hypothetical protein
MFNSDSGESEVVETWQRFVQGLLGVLALVGAGVMAHYYAPRDTTGLEQQVHQLSRQVAELEREQSVSAAAAIRSLISTGFIMCPAMGKIFARAWQVQGLWSRRACWPPIAM